MRHSPVKNLLARLSSAQRASLRLLSLFFGAILLFTFLSRAIDSFSVPLVGTIEPKSGTLLHTASGFGAAESAQQVPVTTLPDCLIADISVREGQSVQEGDTLLTLDLEDLERKIAELADEISRAALMSEYYGSLASEDASRAEKLLERAEEDYKAELEEAGAKVARARRELSRAQEKLDDYKDWAEDRYEGDIDWKESTLGFSDGTYDNLREAVRQRRQEYEEAQRESERVGRSAERALEDAKEVTANGNLNQQKLQQLELAGKNRELSRLRALYDEGGQVKAKLSGVAASLSAGVGTRTGSEKLLLLGDTTAPLRTGITVSEEEARFVSPGDSALLRPATKRDWQKGAVVEGVRPLTGEDEGKYRVEVLLPQGSVLPGQSVEVQVSCSSEQFGTTLPQRALRSDSSGDYVLIVRERSTVMGSQAFAERVNVSVIERDGATAAISGGFLPEDKVIVSSARPIAEGDRVRTEEP